MRMVSDQLGFNMDISNDFPIQSQSSFEDKANILKVRDIFKNRKYSYCEIGSFLGGTLVPFLKDDNCVKVFSIDHRERKQPDERGKNYDYGGITTQTMLDNLTNHGVGIEKLKAYDGSISDIDKVDTLYDLIFIDGEHTDYACFRDFIYAVKHANHTSIIMFHDSNIVFKSLRIIQTLLKSYKAQYRFIKIKNSTVSLLFLGEYASLNLDEIFEIEENLEKFYWESEVEMLNEVIKNRVNFNINYTIKNPPTDPAY